MRYTDAQIRASIDLLDSRDKERKERELRLRLGGSKWTCRNCLGRGFVYLDNPLWKRLLGFGKIGHKQCYRCEGLGWKLLSYEDVCAEKGRKPLPLSPPCVPSFTEIAPTRESPKEFLESWIINPLPENRLKPNVKRRLTKLCDELMTEDGSLRGDVLEQIASELKDIPDSTFTTNNVAYNTTLRMTNVAYSNANIAFALAEIRRIWVGRPGVKYDWWSNRKRSW